MNIELSMEEYEQSVLYKINSLNMSIYELKCLLQLFVHFSNESIDMERDGFDLIAFTSLMEKMVKEVESRAEDCEIAARKSEIQSA